MGAVHRTGDIHLAAGGKGMNVTRAAYRAGTTRLLDLIDSERSLLNFELSYWRAVRDYAQAKARLEALVGGPI